MREKISFEGGVRVPVTDFQKAQDEIDLRLIEEDEDHPDSVELRRIFRESERASEIATALLLVLEMCVPTARRSKKLSEKHATVSGTRLLTLLWMLRSERYDLARIGQADLARSLGVTRALISHYTRFWNRATGLRCRMQKLSGTSEAYRRGAYKGWETRRGEVEEEESPEVEETVFSPVAGDGDGGDECEIGDDYVPSWERSRRGENCLGGVED